MMTERPDPNDFDATMRRTFEEVSAASKPAPDLAHRLVANARAGKRAVLNLGARRRTARWTLPLLAAAAVIVLAVGGAVATNLLTDRHHAPAQQSKSVAPTTPTPTLQPPALPHFHAYYQVSFTDPQHGWALGDAQCATGARTDCAALLATTDGGQSWHAIGLPKGITSVFDSASCGDNGTIQGPCVDSVRFANESDGYVWSLHELYMTTDGGKSWSLVAKPSRSRPWPGAASVVVAGGSVVRLVPLVQCSVPCPGALETSRLGSGDWNTTSPPGAVIAFNNSALTVHDGDVYVFAGSTVDKPSAGILRSTDGGHTWHRIAHDVCGVAAHNADDDPFRADEGVVADDGALAATCVDESGEFLRVAEPGSSAFSAERRYPNSDPNTRGTSVVAAESSQVMTAASTHVNDLGEDGLTTFYRTTDGGQTWQQTGTLPAGITGFHFNSGSVGYALAKDGKSFYVTQDGGDTWQQTTFAA
jgi:photosystem II stability/assembly factor-like uncharacterized protein